MITKIKEQWISKLLSTLKINQAKKVLKKSFGGRGNNKLDKPAHLRLCWVFSPTKYHVFAYHNLSSLLVKNTNNGGEQLLEQYCIESRSQAETVRLRAVNTAISPETGQTPCLPF